MQLGQRCENPVTFVLHPLMVVMLALSKELPVTEAFYVSHIQTFNVVFYDKHSL